MSFCSQVHILMTFVGMFNESILVVCGRDHVTSRAHHSGSHGCDRRSSLASTNALRRCLAKIIKNIYF